MQDNIDNNSANQEDIFEPVTTQNNDDYVIGNGFEVADDYDYGNPPQKNTSGLKLAIWIISIIIVSVVFAITIVVATSEYLGIGFGREGTCVVEIKQGMSTASIAETLKESGAINSKLMFRIYSKLKGYDGKYSYGVYTFNAETGYSDLAYMLMTDGAKAETKTVIIPEAATVEEMADILGESGVCTKQDFLYEVKNGTFSYDFIKEIPADSLKYRFEGYLLPDTYNFYCYDSAECAHLAVDKMLSALNDILTQDVKKSIENSGYNLHQIVTMASLVELEAGGATDDMTNVAAVFYNRLTSPDFQTLGSSPTTKSKYNHGDDRYNTYVCDGLPVGPLCSINASSLNAAINPTVNFPYYYFVTDKSMVFYYNKTIDEHNAIIAKLKRENNWIYETID